MRLGAWTVRQPGVPMTLEARDERRVVVDFNHPLAGKTLYFDVKILDIRAEAKTK